MDEMGKKAEGKVLIVEDEAVIAEMLASFLKNAGYTVVAVAGSGEEAVQKALTLKPELVLMDIRLPGAFDGIVAAEKILQEIDVSIIYLTAYTDALVLDRAEKTQPFGYLVKPFRETELRITVQMALFKHNMEVRLKQSELKFRSMVENSPDAIFLWSPDGKIMDGNQAAEKLFQYCREELIRMDIGQLHTVPEQKENLLKSLREKGFVRNHEVLLHDKSGRLIVALINAVALSGKDSAADCFQAVIHDITERRKREEKILLLQTAIQASSNLVYITDRDGEIVFVNAAFEEVTGYSLAEAQGKTPRLLKSGYQIKSLYKELWRTIGAGKTWQGELINKKKDGSLYTQRTSISPISAATGEITHFLAIAQDVSKEKALEDQLTQATKMDSLGRLAGGIAHDFNNLLTVINGYAEMLFKSLKEEKAKNDVREIIQAGEKAARLTSQILAFSRKQEVSPHVLNINEVIKEIHKMFDRILGEDIDVTLDLAPDLYDIRMDRTQLEQVLMNLVVNARDAMPAGGKLAIHTENFLMDQEFVDNHVGACPGGYIRIAVSDSGVGMDEFVLKRIFEPFFTTKKKCAGTGLGLSIVYGIVQQNNGYISASSRPGEGSCFSLFFPRYLSEERKDAQVEKEEKGFNFSNKVALLVEDDEKVRQVICNMLVALGFTVLEAENGTAALAIAEKPALRIDLLLTDLILPGISGYEIARRFLWIQRDGRILCMSGHEDKSSAVAPELSDKMHFLRKPFSQRVLWKKLFGMWNENGTKEE